MDFDKESDYLESSPFGPGQGNSPPPGGPPPAGYYKPRRRFSIWRVFWGILFGLSLVANVGMFIILVGLVGFVATGAQTRFYQEAVVREGPRDSKIVMVNIDGIIYGEQAENVYRQLKAARQDDDVKAIILRINSPGGTISGSDRIYQEIQRYRAERGKPVVAFMQGVAASGGYYAAVACDKIVAEPTTITGSIGVVMSHFVFQELLEDKLGILPVFLTEGAKKDWPSSFRAPQKEELDYLRERLLTPAYERFVEIVIAGRAEKLSASEVRRLADGSIYGAEKALEEELIDQVGYLDDAVDAAKLLAGISDAQVVEYRRPFSFRDLLTAKSGNTLKLDRETLYKFTTPEIMYLWNAY